MDPVRSRRLPMVPVGSPPGRTWLRTLLSNEFAVGSLFADTMKPVGGLPRTAPACRSSRSGTSALV
jgi:hypothetical protein